MSAFLVIRSSQQQVPWYASEKRVMTPAEGIAWLKAELDREKAKTKAKSKK